MHDAEQTFSICHQRISQERNNPAPATQTQNLVLRADEPKPHDSAGRDYDEQRSQSDGDR
jgi:hypothetical protein